MNDEPNNNPPNQSGLLIFWHELKRRKVIRVASVYIITGWIIIQVAAATFPTFGIPPWAFRFIILMVILGLPVALILAWAFELTPDGIKATHNVEKNTHSEVELQGLAKKRNLRAYALGALLPTLIFGALALFFYLQTDNSGAELNLATVESKVDKKSIAMMPLLNMSSNAENEYFAGGIHEDILTNLSRIKNLQVISRTSMMKYAASEKTLKEIGTELAVDFIVEGSVRRIGNHVRVTIQLINANNDLHLWANNFERELLDVFATQSELAKEISNSLQLEIQPDSVGTLEGMPTFSVKAYDLYSRAVSLEKTEGASEESTMQRRKMLEEATATDSDFAQAWALLKRIYDYQLTRIVAANWYQEATDKKAVAAQLREKSQRALSKAVALAPNNVETLLSQAVDHSWPKSIEKMQDHKDMLDHIIAKYPNNAYAWYHLGWWHSHRRDLTDQNPLPFFKDAALAFEEALRLDPFNARMLSAVMKWYKDRGRQEDVTRIAARLVQILPETAQDRSLIRVSWNSRKNQIVAAFLHTADESFLEQYKSGLKEALQKDEFYEEYAGRWDEIDLSIFNNDEQRVLDISRLPFELKEKGWNPTLFAIINATAMHVYLNRGEMGQALVQAKNIVDNKAVILSSVVKKCPCTPGIIASAYTVLGDIPQARQTLEKLQGQYRVSKSNHIIGMSKIDLEQAVAIAFSEKAKDPKWSGFDDIAAYHMINREFLAHPKVQQYYVQEGKWLNYLADRVPEYAKYKPAAHE
ncbi:hypothetical protein [Paraglaciecola sp. L3A3]|uniref:hypothetical protein n=1 Tax=Paraglaciecola sp. L3A3 TaxID=2686358 RepID=UPI00131DDB59|nr:hypothetical protein [Paraglaciecola sp. L3A3]